MLVFATAGADGAGRSVTSGNMLYRSALAGNDVCYLDFDFGSPTAGAVFAMGRAADGTTSGYGTHRYLRGETPSPERLDVWSEAFAHRPAGSGQLVLMPGDRGGGDLANDNPGPVSRCVNLFLRLNEEFSVIVVDLSAGRSGAAEIALAATAQPAMRDVRSRWLVFHRWTTQHVAAASKLAYDARGLIDTAVMSGHEGGEFAEHLRFVRTATPSGLRNTDRLGALASKRRAGVERVLGSVPWDAVLQQGERLITDTDVAEGIARPETRDAFDRLAMRLADDAAWETL
ncbi:SCO2523 family variant P-loop protein [Actinoplanes sp. NPDC051513]|uniref:SCO2523 family variant P-loop protein n=1 Tax=Actinoplanes sp. NPDC051513 TaxID=3363908 RepID=UPI0037AF919E